MNITELREILKRNHVPDRYYNLPGMLGNDDCECLYCEDGVWKGYYAERGQPYGLKSFASEEEGCSYLWEEMKRRVKWQVSLDAPPLTDAMTAFSEYFERRGQIFVSRGLSFFLQQGFNTQNNGGIVQRERIPYCFSYWNWPLRLNLSLSFADLNSGSNGISSVLTDDRSKQQIQVQELLAACGFAADSALFDYPQEGLQCEEHLDRFAAALERAFDGILKPVLEGASLNSIKAG